MKEITEQSLKDNFIDLIDDGWIVRLGEVHFIVNNEDNHEKKGKTITQALNNLRKHPTPELSGEVICNKIITIFIRRSARGVLNFKEYKEFQDNFLNCLTLFCDEYDLEPDKVQVENVFSSELMITITDKIYKIYNFAKFITIQKIFNVRFNGKFSMNLREDGIKLILQQVDIDGYNKKSLLKDQDFQIAIEMLEKDFTIKKEKNSLYLHPKFEFIKNENI